MRKSTESPVESNLPRRAQAWERPSWWGPEAVLERLQRGELAGEVCESASLETGGDVAASRLRADISKWAGSYEWGDQFTAALALWKKGVRGSLTPAPAEGWQDDFFAAMEETDGNISRACLLVGVRVELVEALREKRNVKLYNAEFAERLRIAEGARIARIRDNVLTQAEQPTVDGAKLGVKVLESAMPGVHGQKQQVEVKVDHEHTFRLAPEVVAAAQARFRALNAGRDQQPAELSSVAGDVIDGDVVEG